MKQPFVSIIIPTKNSAEFLDTCLKSIKNQTYKNIEIIVVDNHSTDKTKEIVNNFMNFKDFITLKLFAHGPERSAQRNYGAQKSKGKYLLFIDSDMILDKKVVEECVNKAESYKSFKVHKVLGGIIIPEESIGEGFWSECKKLERSFYLGVDWIEAARFFSKRVFVESEGYDEELISGEDWDLNQNIKMKYNIGRINSLIKHNEGKLSLNKLLAKKLYYASKIKSYANKKINKENFNNQFRIMNRYKLYFSNPKKLFSSPILGLGMLFMKTSEFIVGGIGYLFKK